MRLVGPNLGGPYAKAFVEVGWELRLNGTEGMGRVFFCTHQPSNGLIHPDLST